MYFHGKVVIWSENFESKRAKQPLNSLQKSKFRFAAIKPTKQIQYTSETVGNNNIVQHLKHGVEKKRPSTALHGSGAE